MSDTISKTACKVFVTALVDAALVVSHDQQVVAANDAAVETLSSSLEGQSIAMFLRSPDVLQAMAQCLAQSSHHQVEFVVRSRVQRTLDLHLSPLGKSEKGALALVLLRDRTREEQIERMRSDFVANASHELRTPLTTLSGFIDTMQGAAKQDEKARNEFLKVMKAQADRMATLIDDLLSLSRIELDEHLAPNSQVNLNAVVRQTLNLLQATIAENKTELDIDLQSDLTVQGDANQLGQVFHNVIENAIKYSGQGKRVTISGRIENGEAIVSVTDNGPGIATHHIPRLTERFYRVNVQDSRMRGGTGLGLAICKHIVNRHRGRLVIESEVGQGSTFSIHLPFVR